MKLIKILTLLIIASLCSCFNCGFFNANENSRNRKWLCNRRIPGQHPKNSCQVSFVKGHMDIAMGGRVTLSNYERLPSRLYALAGGVEYLQPRQLVALGMKKFAEAEIEESIELFDKADEKAGNGILTPFLWQRGISLYYADRFQEGSNQFQYDVTVNPLDAEEIVWDIACQNRLKEQYPEFVVKKMSLPQGKSDRRKIMRTVYSLFRGDGATEYDLARAGHSGSTSDNFYALFYLGLYCESIGERGKAANYMRAAAKSEYARGPGSSDYMTTCAKVHCKLRDWL